MFETVLIQYAHTRILGEMILLPAPGSLDKQLREERNKPAEVMELDKPVPVTVEEKGEKAETTSEEFQLFSKFSNHVSWGFSLKNLPWQLYVFSLLLCQGDGRSDHCRW